MMVLISFYLAQNRPAGAVIRPWSSPLENGRSVSYYTIFVKVIARVPAVYFLRNFAFFCPSLF